MDEMYILETTSPPRPSTSGQQVLGSLTHSFLFTMPVSYVSLPMICDNWRCPSATLGPKARVECVSDLTWLPAEAASISCGWRCGGKDHNQQWTLCDRNFAIFRHPPASSPRSRPRNQHRSGLLGLTIASMVVCSWRDFCRVFLYLSKITDFKGSRNMLRTQKFSYQA